MDYEITITVDTNDADYNTSVSKISQAQLDELKPLIAAIAAFKPYKAKSDGGLDWTHNSNYPYGEYSPRYDLGEKPPHELYPDIDEDTFELFHDFTPFGEHGFHSIVSIEIAPYQTKTKLL